MSLLNTVTFEDAEGPIKAAYEMFMENIGVIPKPMEMMSASPALFELQLKRIEYLSQHPNLSFSLLAHIRYLIAHGLNYPFCTDFNKVILKNRGWAKMIFVPSKRTLPSHFWNPRRMPCWHSSSRLSGHPMR